MNSKLKILVAGRKKEAIGELGAKFKSSARAKVRLRQIVNGHSDPLDGLPSKPDVLVVHIANQSGGELEALLKYPAMSRPPVVVVSEVDDPSVMRLAMKAGARDFLVNPDPDEVVESVTAIADELESVDTEDGRIVAVVNAKGGSGATFLACNLAHLSARATELSTALVGMDMQFPTLPSYFDMKPKHSILQAIEAVDELDAVAIEAMMGVYDSDLKILAARPDDFRFNFESLAENASKLLDLLQSEYDNVIVDVPRQLDELNAQVLSRASRIVLVIQQSLPHIQDASRMQQLLRDQLGIPAEQLVIAVNRFQKNAEIQLDDVSKAFPDSDVVTVSNQFKTVAESINLGIPMYDHARQSSVTKDLLLLQSRLFDIAPADHPALSGGISSLLSKSPLKFLGGQ